MDIEYKDAHEKVNAPIKNKSTIRYPLKLDVEFQMSDKISRTSIRTNSQFVVENKTI